MKLPYFLLFCVINAADCEGEDWLTRIGVSPGNRSLDLEEYHHVILLDKKLWLFSRKYFPQPSHNWGHHITFQGGYSIYFDLETNQWSDKVEYSPLIIDEDLDEFVFVLGPYIYLLLHTAFKEVSFKRFYRWDAQQRNWTEHKSFEVDPLCNNVEVGWRAEIVGVDQSQSSNQLYFILSPHTSPLLYRLSIDEDMVAKLSIAQNITDEEKNILHGQPVQAARINNKIFWLYGVETCGFHIQPNLVMELDLETKEIHDHKFVEEAELPPFSFLGASSTRVLASGQWVHATGYQAIDVDDSRYSSQIWSLTLRESVAWKRLNVEVPKDAASKEIVFVSGDGILYKINSKTGIFSGRLPLN